MQNIRLSDYCCQAAAKEINTEYFSKEDLILGQTDDDSLIFSPLGNKPATPIIALAGITPGSQSESFISHLQGSNVLDAAKKAAFSGKQKEIKELLLANGFAAHIGLKIPNDLNDSPQILTTSLVKCCIKRKQGYLYKAPDIIASEFARNCVKNKFYPEISQYPSLKYVVIFGSAGWQAVNELKIGNQTIRECLENSGKKLLNFPHFSQNFQQRKLFSLSPKDSRQLIKHKQGYEKYTVEAYKMRSEVLKVLDKNQADSKDKNPDKASNNMPNCSPTKTKQKVAKQNNTNLASSDGFIASRYESMVANIIQKLDLVSSTKGKRTSKEIAIFRDRTIICYLSRKTALTKGLFTIVVKPDVASKLDIAVENLMSVQKSLGKKSRYVSSSQYDLFKNARKYPEIDSNEHVGAAYKIEYDANLANLEHFVELILTLN